MHACISQHSPNQSVNQSILIMIIVLSLLHLQCIAICVVIAVKIAPALVPIILLHIFDIFMKPATYQQGAGSYGNLGSTCYTL